MLTFLSSNSDRKKKAKTAFLKFQKKVKKAKEIYDTIDEWKEKLDNWLEITDQLQELLQDYGVELPKELKASLDEIANYSEMYDDTMEQAFNRLLEQLDKSIEGLASQAIGSPTHRPEIDIPQKLATKAPVTGKTIAMIAGAIIVAGVGAAIIFGPGSQQSPDDRVNPIVMLQDPELYYPKGMVTGLNFDFDWNDVSDNYPIAYDLELRYPDGNWKTFEKLDESKFKHTIPLQDGDYKWKVIAKSESGAQSVSGIGNFVIDVNAPTTTIDSTPSKLSNNSTPKFTFSSNEDGTFECSMDNGAFTTCSTPFTRKLPDGSHTFQVRAIDNIGESDKSPASYSWTIDTTAPNAPTLVSPEDNYFSPYTLVTFDWNPVSDKSGVVYNMYVSKQFSLEFSSFDPTVIEFSTIPVPLQFEMCPYVYCSDELEDSEIELPLNEGSYNWWVTATDGAGNKSPKSPTFKLTIKIVG